MKTKLITLLIAIFAVIGSAYTQTKVNIYKGSDVLYSLPVHPLVPKQVLPKVNIVAFAVKY